MLLPKNIARFNTWKVLRSQYPLKRRKNSVTVKLSKVKIESIPITQGVQAKTKLESGNDVAGLEVSKQRPRRSGPAQAHIMPCTQGPAACTCSGFRLLLVLYFRFSMRDEPQSNATSGATYLECIMSPCKSRWANKIKSTICPSMFFSAIFFLAPEKNLLCAAVNQADLKPLPERVVCQNQGATLKWEKI